MPICKKIMDPCIFHFYRSSSLFSFFFIYIPGNFQFFFLIFLYYEPRKDGIYFHFIGKNCFSKIAYDFIIIIFCTFFLLLVLFFILKSHFRKQDCLNFRKRQRGRQRVEGKVSSKNCSKATRKFCKE